MKMPHEIETVSELLDAWDAGGTVFTIELGGLGPGYEQAIQIAAIEISRKLRHYLPTGTKEDRNQDIDKIVNEVIHRIEIGGMSGAQVGAAKWLAWQWCHNGGPKALCDRAKKQGKDDQVIQVSRDFPKAPSPPEELEKKIYEIVLDLKEHFQEYGCRTDWRRRCE